jgi:hypothetical protein
MKATTLKRLFCQVADKKVDKYDVMLRLRKVKYMYGEKAFNDILKEAMNMPDRIKNANVDVRLNWRYEDKTRRGFDILARVACSKKWDKMTYKLIRKARKEARMKMMRAHREQYISQDDDEARIFRNFCATLNSLYGQATREQSLEIVLAITVLNVHTLNNNKEIIWTTKEKNDV